jgi:hypothetical protein
MLCGHGPVKKPSIEFGAIKAARPVLLMSKT